MMNSNSIEQEGPWKICWKVEDCEPDWADVYYDKKEEADRVCNRLNEEGSNAIVYWVEKVN